MATGFVAPGGDLDALFLARLSTARAAVGFVAGGVDISQRYEPIGASTPIAATGFVSGVTDLANLFKSINAGYTVTIGTSGGSFGFSSGGGGNYGAVSPATIAGRSIVLLGNNSIGYFGLTVAGNAARTLFTQLNLQHTNGSIVTLTQASANFSAGGGNDMWTWNGAVVWNAVSPSPRSMTIT